MSYIEVIVVISSISSESSALWLVLRSVHRARLTLTCISQAKAYNH